MNVGIYDDDEFDIDLLSPENLLSPEITKKRDRPPNGGLVPLVIDLTNDDVFDDDEVFANFVAVPKKTKNDEPDHLVAAMHFLKPDLNLRTYQMEGIRWMLQRNNPANKVVGGILADEMGLGKTVEVIAMIAASNPQPGESTLIVAPFCVLTQWLSEIRKFSTFDPVIFHGGSRKLAIRPGVCNVILTTYGVILSETKKTVGGNVFRANLSLLMNHRWTRLILDEGHAIVNPDTKRFKALMQLKTRQKWILTGTPVRNRDKDFFTLLQFLGYPDSELKKIADKMTYRLSTKDGLMMLNQIRAELLLRREKSQIPSLKLPEKRQWMTELRQSDGEAEVYRALCTECVIEINEYVRQGTVLQNWMRILVLINKLRMACVHPLLGLKAEDREKHMVDNRDIKSSTKLTAVFRDIVRFWIQEQRKIIIFSQWCSALDICQNFLNRLNFGYARYDGKMDLDQRADNILKFKEDPTVGVFLVSVKAGGEGLNLCEGSVVLFLDPMWNIPGENQAIDRVHRIGQQQQVDVIRYMMKDTIEENVMKLQRKKQVHEQAILGDAKNIPRLQVEDLKLLFKLPGTEEDK